MKINTAIVIGCLFLMANVVSTAEAQNSSLLQPQTTRVEPAQRQGGMPGMGMAITQAQFTSPQIPPIPQIVPDRSNGDPSGRPTSVLPPEQFPQVIPARPATAPAYVPQVTPPIALARASWTYLPPPPLRQFHLQDIVTIRVDEISRSMAQGNAQKSRNSLFSAALTDFVKLTSRGIVPDLLEDGEPTVAGDSQSQFRGQTSLEAREAVSFNITARIVDIRPNGNLVLEARKKYRHNDNLFETSLSGICRAQDIAADNVILSRDLLDLEIHKEDRGFVRDGYSRGWFQKFFDRVKPF